MHVHFIIKNNSGYLILPIKGFFFRVIIVAVIFFPRSILNLNWHRLIKLVKIIVGRSKDKIVVFSQ